MELLVQYFKLCAIRHPVTLAVRPLQTKFYVERGDSIIPNETIIGMGEDVFGDVSNDTTHRDTTHRDTTHHTIIEYGTGKNKKIIVI